FDAALELREIAGQPEQLELKGERQRVERRTSAQAGRNRVDCGEEARDRLEGTLVLLLLDEQSEHGLGPDEPDREAIGVFTCRPVRVDERRAGDGVQLAGALVQQELDVGERLETGAETGLRLANSLGDRADASPVERVQVENT